MTALVTTIGRVFLTSAETIGRLALFTVAALRALVGARLDAHEVWRCLHRVGVRSLPVVMVTALFAGGTAVVQVGAYVVRYRAYDIVGWGVGFSVFREVGPLLIGLMFSGRVGAHNTAELGTMAVTEQIDALRTLAIDPMEYLVLPRLLAMVIMMTLLTSIGDACAIAGGILTAWGLIDVSPAVFWNSLIEYTHLADFTHGVLKAGAFGVAIGLVSCAFGLSATGGAPGVGRAVNASVVAAAVGIFVIDYFATALFG